MQSNLRKSGLINGLQSVLLLGAMGGILALIGWFIAGSAGAMVAALVALGMFLMAPNISPALVLRAHRASPLSPDSFPVLHDMTRQLAQAAGLTRMPALFYVPDANMNAFTVGGREKPVIALTDGILRALNPREMRGVIAHEMSHIQKDDLRILGLAAVMNRMINFIGTFGGILLLIWLPFMMMSGTSVSPAAVLLLLLAPVAAMLLQQALSRTREYDADRNAALLTGDPLGLASALRKISRPRRTLWEIFNPDPRRASAPSLLSSHPPVELRLERLRALADGGNEAPEGEKPVVHQPEVIRPMRRFEDVFAPVHRPVHVRVEPDFRGGYRRVFRIV